MKQYRVILTQIVAFFMLTVFLLAGCGENNNDTTSQVTTLEVKLTPGTNTTFQIGQATVYFPGDSIKKEVTCYAEVIIEKTSLPDNLTAITDIVSLRFSDPDAYEPDNEGNINFFVMNPLQHQVYSSFEKYGAKKSSEKPPWYGIGGIVGDNSIEAPIPKGTCQVVVATETGNIQLTSSDAHMRKGPYLLLNGNPGSMTVQWQVASTSSWVAMLSWGPDYHDSPTEYPNQAPVIPDSNHFFSKQISNLTPGARTYYCVTILDSDSGVMWSYHGNFLTPPSDDAKSLTFYAYGDTRSYPADHNRVLHYLLADSRADGLRDERQTFLIHAGDYCSRGLQQDRWDGEFFYYRKHVSTNEVFATFPIMGAVGNHEYLYNDRDGNCTYKAPAVLYRAYWDYPM